MSKLPFKEIATMDEKLCKYCHCTEYGSSMGANHRTIFSTGCEGAFCKDAYKKYLESDDEEE